MTAPATERPEKGSATRLVRVGDLELTLSVPFGRQDEPGERISFWFQITRAAMALGRFLQAQGTLQGCRALELGCGLGLAGVVAGRLGAEITFSDYQPEALEHARANAHTNGVERVAVRKLDWESPGEIERFDRILGAEILYDYFYHDCLRAILAQALAPGGLVILADRPRLVVDRFLGRLVHDGFRCDAYPAPDAEDGAGKIEIYSIYRR